MSVQEGQAGSPPGRSWSPGILKNRNFARLFFAGVTSASGFAIGQIALTWIVYNTTKSALDVAYIGVSFVAASVVFSLAAGALVDRHERRKLMVMSDLARAASLGTLVFYLLFFGFNLPVILGVAFVIGSFTTLFQPAERALTPEVVGSKQLANANALVQGSNSIIQFASNGVGGVMVGAVGVIAAFSLNVVTFIVSAVLIVGIVGFAGPKQPTSGAVGSRPSSMVADLREGFGYIARNRALLYLTVSAGLANFFLVMALQFFVVYAQSILQGGAVVFGLIGGSFALGFAPGAYLSARLRTVRFAGWTYILSGVADGFCVLGLVALPYLVTALAFAFMIGLFLGLLNTTWLTTVQLIVPTEMQGRYFGLDQLGSFAVIPVGEVLGGIVISSLGVGTDYTVAAVGTVLCTGLFALSPSLRRLRLSATPESQG